MLSLLESIDIQGRSGLDILIQTWCENAETFQGFWPRRISTMALTQLFVSEKPALQNLIVKGDIIVKPETKDGEDLLFPNGFQPGTQTSSVIMTRSRTKIGALFNLCHVIFGGTSDNLFSVLFMAVPHEFTAIPFPVKALKIIVHDVQSGGESATLTAQGGPNDVDSDDGVSDDGSIIVYG